MGTARPSAVPFPSRASVLAAMALLLCVGCASSYEDAAREAASDPENLYTSSLQALASRNLPAAEVQIRKALAVEPQNIRYLQHFCLVKVLQRNWVDAIAIADAALALDPKATDLRNSRGIAYLEVGRPAEAETDFRAVLADPTFPQKINPRFNLGLALLRQQRWDEALAEFYEVRKASPTLAALPARIGESLEGKGEHEAAIANYLEVLRSTKGEPDPFVLLHLGFCLEKIAARELAAGDAEKARKNEELAIKYYQRLNESAPASPSAREARERLATLSGEPVPAGRAGER